MGMIRVLLIFLFPGMLVWSCRSSQPLQTGEITVIASEQLQQFEGFVPVPPDSVAQLYRKYDRKTFYRVYAEEIQRSAELIDSLNSNLPLFRQIDTLSIEFLPENFGVAARTGNEICLSSGFFFVYNNPSVIRSIVFHEFGHIRFELLQEEEVDTIAQIWRDLSRDALLYLFVDGEYSGNARFGGHPDESPEELFASAFNLFFNRPDEVRARLRYVLEVHYGMIDKLRTAVGANKLVLFD